MAREKARAEAHAMDWEDAMPRVARRKSKPKIWSSDLERATWNLEKLNPIIEDIRHGMTTKSKSDNPEDANCVLKRILKTPISTLPREHSTAALLVSLLLPFQSGYWMAVLVVWVGLV